MKRVKCTFCGSTENLQKHHVVPLSQGGEDSFLNRIWVCKPCHKNVHKHGVGLTRKEIKIDKGVRTVLKVGGSLAITLPADYIKKYNIKAGDKIEITYNRIFLGEPLKTEFLKEKFLEKLTEVKTTHQ